MSGKAHESYFHGEPSIKLTWNHLQAIVLPAVGGNLISFRDTERNFRFLHEPSAGEMADFREHPYLYGIPVLFPPNRYDGGQFSYAGVSYQLPVNEPAKNTHLHGLVHNIPWQVEAFGESPAGSFVVLSLTVDANHEVFAHWPHEFTIRLRYSLSEDGLSQHILLRNTGDCLMPCLLGFHTAINAPFADDSTPEDYTLQVTVGDRWELDDRGLPTGRRLGLNETEKKLVASGLNPYAIAMDNHYAARPENGRNRMELVDAREGVRLIYDVGSSFRQWMIWNNNATPGYFCAEPQVNVVNAPNLALPTEDIGLFTVKPGEIWEETGRLYCTEANRNVNA